MGGGTSKDGRGGLEVVVGGKSSRDQQPLVGRLGKPVLSTAESPGKQLVHLIYLLKQEELQSCGHGLPLI